LKTQWAKQIAGQKIYGKIEQKSSKAVFCHNFCITFKEPQRKQKKTLLVHRRKKIVSILVFGPIYVSIDKHLSSYFHGSFLKLFGEI
jgi:hypothetical protein